MAVPRAHDDARSIVVVDHTTVLRAREDHDVQLHPRFQIVRDKLNLRRPSGRNCRTFLSLSHREIVSRRSSFNRFESESVHLSIQRWPRSASTWSVIKPCFPSRKALPPLSFSQYDKNVSWLFVNFVSRSGPRGKGRDWAEIVLHSPDLWSEPLEARCCVGVADFCASA